MNLVDRLRRALRRLAVLSGAALIALASHGSPTADEFEPCHRLAARTLERCLREAGAATGEACWASSREVHARCRAQVRAPYIDETVRARSRRAPSAAAPGRPARPPPRNA